MTQIFTDNEFTGYEFRCEYADANVGFKHICKVFKDNEEIEKAKTVVNYGNRTWECYPYQTVFEGSKGKLRDILSGKVEPEIDHIFLNKLIEGGYIEDYGEDDYGNNYMLMWSWEQVEGRKEFNEETKEWEVVEKSVYAKLLELAEKKLLSPSVQQTMETMEYAFTDEYAKCDYCGKIYNTNYGELTWVNDELLCDNCIVENEECVEELINNAKEDFKNALKPTVPKETVIDLGYEYVRDENGEIIEFSFAQYTWGERNPFADKSISPSQVEELCETYGGFVHLLGVGQFDSTFALVFPQDLIENVRANL